MLFKFGCRCQIFDSIQPEKSMESDFTSASRPLIPSKISESPIQKLENKKMLFLRTKHSKELLNEGTKVCKIT